MSRLSIKPLDRITEAYNGEMGKDFGNKTRNRINWIVNQVQGEQVIDIGCSQGIVPIILGREGKQVLGLDIAQESIDYALNNLKNEHISVQEKIEFRVGNFMTESTLTYQFDTVLLTEVLEHISDPKSFLKKIEEILKGSGVLIVTVPFGINDYFDHKRTYYYLELYEHLSTYFEIVKVEFLGKWTGVVCIKRGVQSKEIQMKETNFKETLRTLEKAFYDVERDLIERIEYSRKSLTEKDNQIKNIHSQYANNIKEYKETLLLKEEIIKQLERNLIQERNINSQLLNKIIEENTQIKTKMDSILYQSKDNNSAINKLSNEVFMYSSKENIAMSSLLEKNKEDKNHINSIKTQLQGIINANELRSKEQNEIVRAFQKQINEKLVQLEKNNDGEQTLINHINELKNLIDNENKEKQESSTHLKNQNFLLLKENKEMKSVIDSKKREVENLISQIKDLKNDFRKSLDTEEEVLVRYLEQKEQLDRNLTIISDQEKKLSMLERKYAALKSSKLGKITLKYWKLRKNIKK